MAEHRLFDEGTVPECATPEWYAQRERAPHLEQPGHTGRLLQAVVFVLEAIGLGVFPGQVVVTEQIERQLPFLADGDHDE